MAYDARAIANAVLKEAWDKDLKLTKMQLIKLVYFVHGWSLAFFGSPIVSDKPQAWKRGPVYPKLYRSLAGYTSQPINKLLAEKTTDIPFSATFEGENQRRLVSDITEAYGPIHAFTLSNRTHENGTPWDITYKNEGEYSEIDENLIKKHFIELRKKRGIAADTYRYTC